MITFLLFKYKNLCIVHGVVPPRCSPSLLAQKSKQVQSISIPCSATLLLLWGHPSNTSYCPRSHQRTQVSGILKLTFISPQCVFLTQKMEAVLLDLLPKKMPTCFVFVWVIQEKHIVNHQSVRYTQPVQPNIFRNSYLFPPF